MIAHIITRRLAFAVVAAMFAGALAACGGPNEADQAKALQEFLQTRILDKKGIHMPKPNEEQKAKFGRFAADYDVIVKFNDTMSDAMGEKLPGIMRQGNITSVSQLVARRADVAAAREALSGVSATMQGALETANTAKSKLTQPEPLQAVYDQAYARLVTEPAAVTGKIWPELDKALGLTVSFADFLAANKDKFQFNGSMATTRDAKLLAEFNTHVEGMRVAAQGINQAQSDMRKLMYGQ
jgi:Protein of unknown function (DUF3053)